MHELGAGGNRDAGRQRAEMAVAAFNCPTRRQAVAYPYIHGSPYYNIDRPRKIGRSDYAANGGDGTMSGYRGPASLSAGLAMSPEAWKNAAYDSFDATGVIYRRSQCKPVRVRDGTSNTYLLGERYASPNHYGTGRSCADDQGWDTGFDYDVNRWTRDAPRQDRRGLDGCMTIFGSAHAAGFHMAMCDGSVHTISYLIDPETHRRLGNRKDGNPVDLSRF